MTEKTYKVQQLDWSKLKPETPEPKVKVFQHGSRQFQGERKINDKAVPVYCRDCGHLAASRSDLMSHRYSYH